METFFILYCSFLLSRHRNSRPFYRYLFDYYEKGIDVFTLLEKVELHVGCVRTRLFGVKLEFYRVTLLGIVC